MASAIPSLLVAYEGDTGLMGFTSTSQGFFMLGSGPNLNNLTAGGSETDAQTPFPAGTISNLWCRVKTAATAVALKVHLSVYIYLYDSRVKRNSPYNTYGNLTHKPRLNSFLSWNRASIDLHLGKCT
jgi:hypothetical protein